MSVPDDHLTRAGLIHTPINTLVHKCSMCGQQWFGAHTCDGKAESGGSRPMRLGGVPDLDPPGRLPTPIPDYIDPPAPDPALDLQMDVEKLIGEMNQAKANVVRLVMAGYQRSEVCKLLGLSEAMVRNHLRAARAGIHAALSEKK